MTREARFNFANDTTLTGRDALLSQVFTENWRKGLTPAGLAVAMHQAHADIKNVALVRHTSGYPQAQTVRVKFHDGGTMVFHCLTYESVLKADLTEAWSADVTVKDGQVTVH